MSYRLVITTCPDMAVAGQIADTLVAERLAACVNILPGAVSVYEWQGRVERDQELILLIKSRSDQLEELESRLLALHPYELPELIAVPIEQGLAPYLSWIDTQLDTKVD
ncbi:MAG: divalent-cation tolerance protein CutA [Pseudomonadota bacterium]